MNVNRVLEIQDGNAVDTLRAFLIDWWGRYRPDALLAPVEVDERQGVAVKLIEDPAELASVNPFTPLLTCNSATNASRLMKEHPHSRMAAILRPCELRAFVELQKRERAAASPDAMIVIGVDCLGTFSLAEYQRLVEASSAEETTLQVLRNATEGGLRPQNFRTACQICDWCAPRGADITIGSIGIPSDQYLLVIARDEATDAALGLGMVTRNPASESMVSRRETMVGAIADTRAGLRRNMIEEMKGACRFDDLGCILAWFASCSLCGACLKACPLYDEEIAELMDRHGVAPAAHSPLGDVVSLGRWLASCAGCGMCEEECSMDVPLFLLISALSHRIRDKMRYRSGDPVQQLPWVPV
jgi:formate dehydrogenase subunit beta